MKTVVNTSLRARAAEALRKARASPVGPCRNEFRQIAICLRWLERHAADGVQDRALQIVRSDTCEVLSP